MVHFLPKLISKQSISIKFICNQRKLDTVKKKRVFERAVFDAMRVYLFHLYASQAYTTYFFLNKEIFLKIEKSPNCLCFFFIFGSHRYFQPKNWFSTNRHNTNYKCKKNTPSLKKRTHKIYLLFYNYLLVYSNVRLWCMEMIQAINNKELNEMNRWERKRDRQNCT